VEFLPDELNGIMSRPKDSAFTLIELLMVLGIIALMASLMAPMLSSVLRGTSLTEASDKVIGLLSLSHQAALTRSQTIEVRFYSYTNPEMPGDTGGCHGLQAFSLDDSGKYSPITKLQLLPQNIIITTNANLSSLLGSNNRIPYGSGGIAIPRVGTNYSYNWFRYYRSGGTSLQNAPTPSNNVWCLTLENLSDENVGATTPPPQSCTLTVDPYNGTVRTYRPTR
jgi:uncharacterized protein (TIGR02596 family)